MMNLTRDQLIELYKASFPDMSQEGIERNVTEMLQDGYVVHVTETNGEKSYFFGKPGYMNLTYDPRAAHVNDSRESKPL